MPSKAKANTESSGESTTNGRYCRAEKRTASLAVIRPITGPGQREDRGDHEREAETPGQHQPDRARERGAVGRAERTAAELLGGIGKAVEEEGADQQEIVEHRIGGERGVAGARALRGEEQKRRDQRRGADHDVAVDLEHAKQFVAVEQQRSPDRPMSTVEAAGDQEAKPEAGRFRDHRGYRRPGDPHAEPQHEQRGRARIDQVDRDLHGERQPGARLSDQPAEHDVIGERQRRRPDSDRRNRFLPRA